MVCFGTILGLAQQKSESGAKTSAAGKSSAKQSPAAKQSGGTVKQAPGTSGSGGQSGDLFGGDSNGRPKGPTEITATQEAQFDTKSRTGVFIGNVKVVDPQFTLTSDRLMVHLNKDEDGGGLNDALAQGNVVIVHLNQPKTQAQPVQTAGVSTPGARTPAIAPSPATAPTAGVSTPGARTPATAPSPATAPTQPQQPTISTGKSENALYEAKDGSITLTGWPQVTQGGNTHIATAPGVKMVLYKDGRMQTYGSTRTLIEDRTTATNTRNANGAQ
jgi:lipopolysaccharide export system protein LptA